MSSGSAASFTKTMPPTPTGSNTEQSPHNELGTEEHGPYAPPELDVIHNVKSALKKTDGSDIAVAGSGIDDKDGGDGGMIHQGEVKKKSLKWDEYAIEEHDLLRGTRMKIDEPDTPFEYYDHNGDDDASGIERNATGEDQQPNPTNLISLDQSALERKLGAVAAVRECFPSEEGGRDEAQRQITREREFSMSRKHHYNEMEMLKKFRAANPEGLLDDEDEDEDANDMEV